MERKTLGNQPAPASERAAAPAPAAIAVTGVGVTTCLGAGAGVHWQRLAAGSAGLGAVTRFDTAGYPVQSGGEAPPPPANGQPEEIAQLERVIAEAFSGAGLGPRVPPSQRAALVLGSSLAGSSTGERFFAGYLRDGPARAPYAGLEGYYVENHLERLARRFGIDGPALLISNACAAGGSCIARGASLLAGGRADLAICAGFDPLSIFTFAGFGSLMALSADRIRPFSRHRDGMLLGDGYACLILEPAGAARERNAVCVGRLCGWGESADSHHLTQPHPEGGGAALAMRRALARAGLAPHAIDYVNCHGTATRPNDAAEARALRAVFGERLAALPVSSSKPFFGHTLGGAGAVEAVVTLLALANQRLPPNLSGDVDPELGLLDIVEPARAGAIEHAMSNNFGFGGANVSLIFGRGGAV